MAKFFNDIELIKTYESLQLLSTSLCFFYISGFSQTIIPYFEAKNQEEKGEVFRHHFWILCSLAIVTASLIALYALVFKQSELNLYFWFAISVLINIPSFALESYYLAYKQGKKLFIWGILVFCFQIAFLVLPILYFNDLKYGIIGSAFFAILKLLFTVYELKPSLKNLNLTPIKKLSKYAAPVLLSFLIGGSYVYINAFIVEYFLSAKDFVLFRFGAREFPLFLIIANSFSLVYSGKIANGLSEGNLENELSNFKNQNKKLLHQLFPVAIVLMLVSKPVFAFLYSKDTENAYLVFNILLFLIFSRVLFPQTILLGLQKTKTFIIASSIELISGILFSLLFIKPYGLQGVCWAMVIAFMIEKIYLIFLCYQNKISFFKYFPIYTYLLYSSLLLIVFYITLHF